MIRQLAALSALSALLLGGAAVRADGPAVVGDLDGVELCTQEVCGQAVFIGVYRGTVDGRFAFGYWFALANHGPDPANGDLGPLPADEGGTTNIVGTWGLDVYVLRGFRFRQQSLGGELVGTLTNRGDNDLDVDNFDAQALLLDGDAAYEVEGVLRHDRFPPAINLSIRPAE